MEYNPGNPMRQESQPQAKENRKNKRRRHSPRRTLPLAAFEGSAQPPLGSETASHAESYQLPGHSVYGGEVIIELDHKDEERTIPLHEHGRMSQKVESSPVQAEAKKQPVVHQQPRHETLPKTAELPVNPEAAIEDQPAMPEDRQLQNSIWHRIELDKKTGRPVENPSLEYGREYYNERRHEVLSHDQKVDAAAGEVALVADALKNGEAEAQTQPQPTQGLPDASTKSKLSLSDAPKKATDALKQSAAPAVSGPLWPYVLVLIAIIIAIIIAIS